VLEYARPIAGEPTDRAIVKVVFLRMDQRPVRPLAVFPDGVTLTKMRLTVPQYRALYHEVGSPWLWWLRRLLPDAQLAQHLASPSVAVHLLRVDGEAAGFFETEIAPRQDVNLNYFGLLPGSIGKGLGRIMLDAAVDCAFAHNWGVRGMTVNTCSADHPNALPNYLAAGFKKNREVVEVWDIPRRLGLTVPEHLRG